MSLLPLVIRSGDTPPAKSGRWEDFTINIQNFTKSIQTQSVGNESEDISRLSNVISGMPTIFARANMFRVALENISDLSSENKGLMAFYKSLIDEWRGLIACIALNSDRIYTRRVGLVYNNGDTKESTSNVYEVTGSFGNMLFHRKKIWSNPKTSEPFIDVLIYKKDDGNEIVIGGTSPDSLLFTSASYNLGKVDSTFIKVKKTEKETIGKFTDPVKNKSLDPSTAHKLRSYIQYIRSKLNELTRYYIENIENQSIVEVGYHESLIVNLEQWTKELDSYIASKGVNFDSPQLPQINHFQSPFDIVLNHKTTITALDGVIYEEGIEGGVEFDPKELLLPNTVKIACVDDSGNADFLANKPIILLKSSVLGHVNQVRHFLLPLTPKGIMVFGKNLSTVLGLNKNSDVSSRISGVYNPETGELSVEMNLFTTNGKPLGSSLVENYKTTSDDIHGKDILVWPNFISPKWNKYFLFSELPHNSPRWKAIPFCMDTSTRVMFKDDEKDFEPKYIAENGIERDKVDAKILVEYEAHKLSGNKYLYEIFESKYPFKGFKIINNTEVAGFAVIDYGTTTNSPISIISDIAELRDVHIGVDFGSTNSAVAYRIGSTGEPKGYKFKNRRVSLFGPEDDQKDNKVKPAVEDEVFYFQNDEIFSNEIKSILSVHNENRLKDDKGQNDLVALSREHVKGGFPCFEKNLPIEDSTINTYKLRFRNIGEAYLIHNMKWGAEVENQPLEQSHRSAYLKSLLLHIYADMFSEGFYLKSLKWAYPSAMGKHLIGLYNSIWTNLHDVNPLDEGKYPLRIYEAHQYLDLDGGDDWGGTTEKESTNNANSWGTTVGDSGTSDWGNTQFSGSKVDNVSNSWDNNTSTDNSASGIDYESTPLQINFEELNIDSALTESVAVANYLKSKDGVGISENNRLTLCFDIGGSTTDIMVLGKMRSIINGQENLSLIKQSSIRFAAQRISKAVKYSPNFQRVLIDFLNNKGIKVEGINNGGENKYSPNTASYYFEQLVDRLEGDDYNKFYQSLSTNCKELFSVNLYVTGLIVFYAGQLAKKVKVEIDNSPNKPLNWSNPTIGIQFTGKGSRIMDWFPSVNPEASKKYYLEMFLKGFGGLEEAQLHLQGPPIFQDRMADNSEDVKYEVAKGLAANTDKLFVPDIKQKPLELIGEEGFLIFDKNNNQIKLDSSDTITTNLLESIGNKFIFNPTDPSIPCPRFMQFAQLYYQVVTNMFGFNATIDDFMNGFKNMNITDFIKLTPEYKEAKNNPKGFDFVAPIIILEGMKFYEDVILKKLNV